MRPDDVTKNVALGNQYAKFQWKDVATTDDPGASIEPHKQAFNRGRPVDEQSHNWRIVPSRSLGSMLSAAATGGRYQTYVIQREETPDEVRKRRDIQLVRDRLSLVDSNMDPTIAVACDFRLDHCTRCRTLRDIGISANRSVSLSPLAAHHFCLLFRRSSLQAPTQKFKRGGKRMSRAAIDESVNSLFALDAADISRNSKFNRALHIRP
ncbi:hypothetical protein DR63_1669 [Burkholderia thailandensis E264]|nr:hypothetical protein BTQ_3170 [Burkholderia thailandensis 2002721723]AIP24581.1 hypothetical protein DR63_1669 [Burkholderia thailandensis E264]AJX99096.1 hypothetical protein BG87_653 [Burkholderia thailandensis 2002721643]